MRTGHLSPHSRASAPPMLRPAHLPRARALWPSHLLAAAPACASILTSRLEHLVIQHGHAPAPMPSQVSCWMPATAARAAGWRAVSSHYCIYSRRLAGVGCLGRGSSLDPRHLTSKSPRVYYQSSTPASARAAAHPITPQPPHDQTTQCGVRAATRIGKTKKARVRRTQGSYHGLRGAQALRSVGAGSRVRLVQAVSGVSLSHHCRRSHPPARRTSQARWHRSVAFVSGRPAILVVTGWASKRRPSSSCRSSA